ncbi:zincin [Colletotrichum somersetense]|nr:zincin [Colletotrichum somersetense]
MLVNSLALSPSFQSLDTTSPQVAQLLKREERRRKAEIVGGILGKDSEEWCNSTQVQRISKDLAWMHSLSAAANDFLLQPDSHTTAAYIAWFGETNASPRWAAAIRTEIYQNIWFIGQRPIQYAKSVEEGSHNAITFGCFPPDPVDCSEQTFAVAIDGRYIYVMLCPPYFSQVITNYDEAFVSWREKREDINLGGLILLHEMLHQRIVVGWNGYASDHAYSAENCLNLPSSMKAKNAENYALFALEVKANPERAKLQVDMKSSEAKDKIARRLLEGPVT